MFSKHCFADDCELSFVSVISSRDVAFFKCIDDVCDGPLFGVLKAQLMQMSLMEYKLFKHAMECRIMKCTIARTQFICLES